MEEIIEQLKDLPHMKFVPAASEEEIETWEHENNMTLPQDYKEWLRFSDGGAIFIPGIQFYGVAHKPLLSYRNQTNRRGDLPDELLIIGSFSYGDLLCFVKGEDTIVQWEHEGWEEFTHWENLSCFLSEAIDMSEKEI